MWAKIFGGIGSLLAIVFGVRAIKNSGRKDEYNRTNTAQQKRNIRVVKAQAKAARISTKRKRAKGRRRYSK